MKYKIRWTPNAFSDFTRIVQYINEKWGRIPAEEFINKIDNTAVIISVFPHFGKIIHYEKQIRTFVVSKQITMIYRIKSNNIHILNLFDNRQNPDNLKLNEPN